MTITGEVTDEKADAVEGAVLFLVDQSGTTLETTSSQSDGTYAFETEPNETYHILCQYRTETEGFNSISRPFASPNTIVDFRIQGYTPPKRNSANFKINLSENIEGKLNGYVQETDSDNPERVPNAVVEVEKGDGTTLSQVADDQGEWVFDNINEGELLTFRVKVGGEERLAVGGGATFDEAIVLEVPVFGPEISNPSPNNEEVKSSGDIELSIDVTDKDFPSDEIIADFYDGGGNKIDTETKTTSEQGGTTTVTGTYPEPSSKGNFDWYVEVADRYTSTETVTSDTFTFSLTKAVPKTKGAIAIVYAQLKYVGPEDGDRGRAKVIVTDKTTGFEFLNTNYERFRPDESNFYQMVEAGDNLNGNKIDYEVKISDCGDDCNFALDFGGYIMSEHIHNVQDSVTARNAGEHTHPAVAGVIEDFLVDTSGENEEENIEEVQYYPEDVEILVNGRALNVSLGDGTGPFEEVVDLEGELRQGQVNRIEATSKSVGNLQLFIEGDVYRQILGGG